VLRVGVERVEVVESPVGVALEEAAEPVDGARD